MTPIDEDLEEWIRDRLDVRDIVAVRQRPWGSVWQLSTVDGRWWAKAGSPATGHEPRLVRQLSRAAPDLLPEVHAHDRRPWLLTRHAGTSARELLAGVDASAVVDFWCALLPRYAELQRSVAAATLTTLGVPDLSPERLVGRFDELVGDGRWVAPAVAPEWTRRGVRLDETRRRLAAAATELAGGPGVAVQHDDLHAGNVFAGADGVRVIDWGDAVVSHPFGTLRVTLDGVVDRTRRPSGSAELRRLTDSYLEVWLAGGESRPELQRQLDLALAVAGLGRAAGWARALGTPEAGRPLGFEGAVAHWLAQLAADLGA